MINPSTPKAFKYDPHGSLPTLKEFQNINNKLKTTCFENLNVPTLQKFLPKLGNYVHFSKCSKKTGDISYYITNLKKCIDLTLQNTNPAFGVKE